MTPVEISYYQSPAGELIIGAYDGQICLCDWKYRSRREAIDRRIKDRLGAEFAEASSDITQVCIEQLKAYFDGELKVFDLPLLLPGSEFQCEVWRALRSIPYGVTLSYGQLAHQLGKPGAVRAVANANGANAISIIVPCHRIVGTNGELTGYAGGLAVKQKLLHLESADALPRQASLPF